MRVGWLITLTLLSIFTVGAYRPLVVYSGGIADPALIFLAWLALIDRWPRILLVGSVICLYRSIGGISSGFEIVCPVAAMILSVRWLRQVLDPHDRGDQQSRDQNLKPLPAVVGIENLVTALMLPVLDLVTPLLRSARYPL